MSEGKVSDNGNDGAADTPQQPTADRGICPFLSAGAISGAGGPDAKGGIPTVQCIGGACHFWYETQVVNADGAVIEEIANCQLALSAEWSRKTFSLLGRIAAATEQRITPVGPVLQPRRDGR